MRLVGYGRGLNEKEKEGWSIISACKNGRKSDRILECQFVNVVCEGKIG